MNERLFGWRTIHTHTYKWNRKEVTKNRTKKSIKFAWRTFTFGLRGESTETPYTILWYRAVLSSILRVFILFYLFIRLCILRACVFREDS